MGGGDREVRIHGWVHEQGLPRVARAWQYMQVACKCKLFSLISGRRPFPRPASDMSLTKDEARRLLQESELRVTAPRLAVLRVLAEARGPLSHTEVLEHLGETDWHPATIYRTLVKLRDARVAPVVSRAEGIDRYALAQAKGDGHRHPHFLCEGCGRIVCLPPELITSMSMDGPWAASIRTAMVQLQGECPDCLERAGEAPR